METRGDVLIWYIQESNTGSIIEDRPGDTDHNTHNKDPTKPLLDWLEKDKKDNHGGKCHEQQKIFSVCSLCRWNAQKGIPSLNHEFESNHGRKNEGTHFARECLG